MRDAARDAAIERALAAKPFGPVDIEGFCRLFQFTSKRQLEKYARTLIVHYSDLALFIFTCMAAGQPFAHFRHHVDYRPKHLDLTDKDHAALGRAKVGPMTPEVAKAFSKITQTFKERRLLSGHLFVTPTNPSLVSWHFFYFDQRDLDPVEPHWGAGAHIHFINHLWPNLTAQGVWDTFRSHKPRIKRALHIRCLDARWEHKEGRFRRRPKKG